jgi:hypothetical protein
MKKVDYKKLALLGITGGLLMASQAITADVVEGKIAGKGIVLAGGCGDGKCGGFNPTRHTLGDDSKAPKPTSPTTAPEIPSTLPNQKGEVADNAAAGKIATNVPRGHMSEADLVKSINADSRDTYNSLSPEGKALALELANQACKGHNSCKGLNSCKTANNSCAGQGGCKGQSSCAFKDKNQAVKVAAMKMASKRASVTK